MNRMARTIPQSNNPGAPGFTASGRERSQPKSDPRPRPIIPYEYVADFPLTGNVGNLVQDVINISMEGVFVAVAIGYGLAEERAEPINLPVTPDTLGEVTLADLPPDVLIDGFRLNPNLRALV